MTFTLRVRVLAELGGTAMLVAIGTGSLVIGPTIGGAPLWAISIAWFLAVAIPVLLLARISGAHLNPAVTLALVVGRKFPAREAPAYVLGQVAGAFAGSLAVLATLGPGESLGAVQPSGGSLLLTFGAEFVFSALLVMSVFYLVTRNRFPNPAELLLPGLVVGGATYLFGARSGISLNPARSLAPEVLSGNYSGAEVFLFTALAAALLVSLAWRWALGAEPRVAAVSPQG